MHARSFELALAWRRRGRPDSHPALASPSLSRSSITSLCILLMPPSSVHGRAHVYRVAKHAKYENGSDVIVRLVHRQHLLLRRRPSSSCPTASRLRGRIETVRGRQTLAWGRTTTNQPSVRRLGRRRRRQRHISWGIKARSLGTVQAQARKHGILYRRGGETEHRQLVFLRANKK